MLPVKACARCKREFMFDEYAPSTTIPSVCWSCLTWDEMRYETARHGYECGVTDGRPSCALSLLALWDHPHSPSALRFAYHALVRAESRGLSVFG